MHSSMSDAVSDAPCQCTCCSSSEQALPASPSAQMQTSQPSSLPEVVLGDSPHGDGARLHKVLERHVIDALGRQDDICAGCQHLTGQVRPDLPLRLDIKLELLQKASLAQRNVSV